MVRWILEIVGIWLSEGHQATNCPLQYNLDFSTSVFLQDTDQQRLEASVSFPSRCRLLREPGRDLLCSALVKLLLMLS
jgi:hypothetical protein